MQKGQILSRVLSHEEFRGWHSHGKVGDVVVVHHVEVDNVGTGGEHVVNLSSDIHIVGKTRGIRVRSIGQISTMSSIYDKHSTKLLEIRSPTVNPDTFREPYSYNALYGPFPIHPPRRRPRTTQITTQSLPARCVC